MAKQGFFALLEHIHTSVYQQWLACMYDLAQIAALVSEW